MGLSRKQLERFAAKVNEDTPPENRPLPVKRVGVRAGAALPVEFILSDIGWEKMQDALDSKRNRT